MNHVAYCGLIALLGGATALQLDCDPSVVSWALFIVTVVLGAWGGVLAYQSLNVIKNAEQPPTGKDARIQPPQDEGAEQASFVAKVSHELRTPLHNISGLIRVLFLHSKDQTTRYYLSMMQDATESLLKTINEVLDFSKANTGQLTVRATDVDVRSVARKALRTVAPRAADKKELEFFASVAPEVPRLLRGDEDRIQQILVNLLGNSIKFTERGFIRLVIEVVPGGQSVTMVKFSVTDTGAGIPESKIASVFEPFQQVDMTVVRKTQGTGLGLTIVKQLVELQGGEVGVESEYRKGSTFWFTVPCTVHASSGNHATMGTRLDAARVHVVGGEEHVLAELTEAFKRYGATVSRGAKSASLLDSVAADPTHVVIVESALQGDATWRSLRHFAEDNGPDSVIVLLSATAIEARERASKEGFTNILSLPVLADDVCFALVGLYKDELGSAREIERLQSVIEPLRILIADDIPVNQFILRSVLEEAGHHVHAVSDGGSLFSLLENQISSTSAILPHELFDVVLTDIQMPVMDGLTVIRKTRELEKAHGAPPLPLIAVTAHAFDEERDRITEAGADGMVTKPLDAGELQRLLSLVKRRSVVETSGQPGATIAQSSTQSGSGVGETFIHECELVLPPEHLGVVDTEAVFERSNRNPRRTLLILRSFVEGAPNLIEDLDGQMSSSDSQALVRVAHSLKGVLAEAGAINGAKQAALVERMASSGEKGELSNALSLLSEESKRALQAAEVIVSSFSKTGERLPKSDAG